MVNVLRGRWHTWSQMLLVSVWETGLACVVVVGRARWGKTLMSEVVNPVEAISAFWEERKELLQVLSARKLAFDLWLVTSLDIGRSSRWAAMHVWWARIMTQTAHALASWLYSAWLACWLGWWAAGIDVRIAPGTNTPSKPGNYEQSHLDDIDQPVYDCKISHCIKWDHYTFIWES